MPTDYDEANKNYQQIAIDLARSLGGQRFGTQLAESHWNLEEFVDRHGRTKAACGKIVPEDLISGDPSCEPCAAACRAYNGLNIT